MILKQQLEHRWKQAAVPPDVARLHKENQTISGIPWASSSETVPWSRKNASRADTKAKDRDTEQTFSWSH